MSDIDAEVETLYREARDFGATTLRVSLRTPFLILDKLVVGEKGIGNGTKIMGLIVALADRHGLPMALTPSTDFGGSSRARLEKFYRRFGFVPNRGRSHDFTTTEGMIRPPRRANPLSMRSGGCPGHKHPSLASPVAPEVFAQEFLSVFARGRVDDYYPRPRIVFTEQLARTHARNSRRYAECEVVRSGKIRRRFVYFAPQALWLPPENSLGLMAHESGHLALWDHAHTEGDADEAALRLYGVEVSYDHRWPGKGLQRGRYVRRGT